MDIINIKFDQAEAEIGSLGMQGENKKVALHIDCSSVLEKHPGAAILVNYDPRLPGEPYFNLPVTALGNGIFEAVLTPMEMACDGLKRIQVRAVEGDYEDRSKTFIAYVEKSVYDFRPPAGPVSDWLDQLRDALAKADAAQQHGPVIGTNGNWYVWKDGAYVDTGVAAGSDISPEQIGEAVSDYLQQNPFQETDPTVPDWAKAESKPSYSYNELTDKPAIPDAYTLPVASESVLGGVKPISKTDDMTQGVGVDSEGKLWALPGGGESTGGGSGGIPTVTTEGTSTAFTATIPEITELYHGLTIDVIFHTRNTSDSPTFNLNGYGDKYLYARQVSKSANAMVDIKRSFISANKKLRLMYDADYDRWVCDLYVETVVSGGGTGRNTLTSGSYLVGNGTELVNLKTPAQVLADILPSTAADAGKVPTVQADGTIALAEVSGGGGGDGSSYELPVASPTVLGGVKPINKTDAMIQGVGVDSEGKLWALPGGGGGGAEWTHVSLVTEEEVESVTLNLIPNWEEVQICVNLPSNVAITVNRLVPTLSNAYRSWGNLDMTTTSAGHAQAWIHYHMDALESTDIRMSVLYGSRNGTAGFKNMAGPYWNENATERIEFKVTTSGTVIPVGSKFQVFVR